MARGDMRYATTEIRPSGAEILNREVFEGVPMTIDFTDVSTTDSDTGEKVVKAGSVISGTGTVIAATPWTGGAGILLFDVYEHRPQGTILKKAYINKSRAERNAGITYDADLTKILPMIVVE